METMLKMSFYNGTLNRETLKEFIKKTDKPIRYTYGLGYRNPTTHKVLIDKDRALDIVATQSLLDADEYEEYLHLNAYSDNDMW